MYDGESLVGYLRANFKFLRK